MAVNVGSPGVGALVISLDFELHWGVRDKKPVEDPYTERLHGVWRSIPRMLELFERYQVAATWATVGFLFAKDRDELEAHHPALRPAYRDPLLDPYVEPIGECAEDDPLHYGWPLIEKIRATPRQELGTHTYSHYYCLEEGQTRAAFAADLESAARLAARRGVTLESIVFPRNQHNPDYASALREHGLRSYRGNPRAWMYQATDTDSQTPLRRALRLLDTYVNLSGANTVSWGSLEEEADLFNIPASFFVRPFSPRLAALEPLRLRRLTASMTEAARSGEIIHLWWHPHNFGAHLEENARFLGQVLAHFKLLERRYGMRSLTMSGVVEQLTSSPREP